MTPPVRSRERLSHGWRFSRGEPEGGSVLGGCCVEASYDDSQWRQLEVPHDWGVEEAFDINAPGETGKLNCQGVGWYRKTIRIEEIDLQGSVHLEVDGAMSNAAVWVNGVYVGGWCYGYSSFSLDITSCLRSGADNILAIRLENYPDSSRWYTGGGLYRNVWLRKTRPVRVAHHGVHIVTQSADENQATVSLSVELEDTMYESVSMDLSVCIRKFDTDDANPVVCLLGKESISVSPQGLSVVELEACIEKPMLWEPGSPHLYVAECVLEHQGVVVDRVEVRFGVRTAYFDAKQGFILNGHPLRLNGVCLHHDLGPLGAAVNVRAMERQLEILLEMGVNAIRCSHNPPAPEWLDLCDRMGVLVIDELTDCWRDGKKSNDYHSIFDAWVVKDLQAMLRRDRNHPCVILWSIGNEIQEQLTANGAVLSAQLRDIVRAVDTSRGVTAGLNYVESGFNGFQHSLDVFGWNYKPQHYGDFIERNPNIPLYGSETSSCVSSRGEYFFPVDERRENNLQDYQVSSYDLYFPHWGTSPDDEFEQQDRHSTVAGEFVWTGFDYLGEPTPYNYDLTNLLNAQTEDDRRVISSELENLSRRPVPSRSSYFGIVDLCGFRKDRFYLYQARWCPNMRMAHILPHWNWPERVGKVTPVQVYTTGDEAELFLNGRSLGRKRRSAFSYRFRWDDVVYEPGEIRVITYKDGEYWAEALRRTTGAAYALELVADRTAIMPGNQDAAFVTVKVVDEAGHIVPREKSLVKFDIDGPGRCIAVDNGDPARLEPFYAQECRAFNGLALAILQFKPGQDEPFTLVASAKGMRSARVTLSALSSQLQVAESVCLRG